MESLFLIAVFIKALVFNDFSVFEVWEQFKKSTSDDGKFKLHYFGKYFENRALSGTAVTLAAHARPLRRESRPQSLGFFWSSKTF